MAGIRSRILLLGASLLGMTCLGKLLAREGFEAVTALDEKPNAFSQTAMASNVQPPRPAPVAGGERGGWAAVGGGDRERARRRRQIEQGILQCSPMV